MISKFYKGHHYLVPIIFHHAIFVFALWFYGATSFNIGLSVISAYIGFLIFAHYVGHLYFGHVRYKDTLFNKVLSVLLTMMLGTGAPLNYAITHRQHHRYSDTDRDPHSPKEIGWWRVWFLMWKHVDMNPMIARDLAKSEFQLKLYKNFVLVHFILIGLLALIDPRIVAFVISPVVIYTLHASGIVNWRGHAYGSPRNVPEVAIFNPFGWRHRDHHEKYSGKSN